ncbi:MAG: CorA family divalent cation transporter [Sulfurimonadaceae bacterium]|jgi:magnesium transporter|nr:CorA family divalent cation transporter [Sulfurimonadaceae bacterium]
MIQAPFTIHQLHIEDILNPVHPSAFILEDDYNLLIVRLPSFLKEFTVTSYPFLLHKEQNYFYEREKEEFISLGIDFQHFYKQLDACVDKVVDMLLNAHEDIELYEENFHASKMKNFLYEWHNKKKEMLYIHRLVIQAVRVMSSFITAYHEDGDFLYNEFHDILEHLERSERSAQSALSKLDQIYKFYAMSTSDKTNQSIFYLTILSAIFLPLNLIVGFFGMNTGGLLFAEHPHGTLIVTSAMLILALFLSGIGYIYLKNKRY